MSGSATSFYLREGFRTVNECLVETMVPHLIGRDASEVEAIWRELWTASLADGRGGAPVLALSAIDVALWDIVGQAAGMPLHRLWGHYRPRSARLRLRRLAGARTRRDGGEGAALKAEGYRDQDAVGHAYSDAEDLENVRRVREAVGPGFDIMVDVNMAWTADHAILQAASWSNTTSTGWRSRWCRRFRRLFPDRGRARPPVVGGEAT